MFRKYAADRGRGLRTWGPMLVQLGLAGSLLLGWPVFAQPSGGESSSDTAALVNGTTISTLELDHLFLARVQVPYPSVQTDQRAQEIRRQLLDTLIDRELLLQESKAQKMIVPPQKVDEELQELIQRFPSKEVFGEALKSQNVSLDTVKKDLEGQILRQQLVKKEILEKISVNSNEYQDFYERNKSKYVEEEQVRARHILIKVAPDASAVDDSKLKDKAKKALQRVKKGEDFGGLAKELSEDGSSTKGGDLGFFGRGRMVPSFEEAAFTLKPGQVSDLVRTQFGYHIIKVEEHKAAKPLSYDEVKERVTEDLTRDRTLARYQEYIAQLRGRAKIEILLP
ncbi:MAG: peptidylprolyl isomerase [Nitrospinae bacterium]|nr:peptidylprolyl isomerase [Nitrospinota bacterium]